MAEAQGSPPADPQRLRLRARLLEFLKFRVLAAQETFFTAFVAGGAPQGASLDPARLRAWLKEAWPEALALSDRELQDTFAQAHRLYVN